MWKKTSAILMALVVVLVALPAFAAKEDPIPPAPKTSKMLGPGTGEFRLGPVEVHPFAGITETYNDNIYKNYDALASESDFITTLTPGVQLLLPFRSHNFQLNYRADINRYSSRTETNYTSQLVGGEINLDFPAGLQVNVTDYYANSELPRKAKETPGLTGSADPYRALPYSSNDFNTRIKYQFVDKWAAEVRYNNYLYEYKNTYDNAGSYKRNLGGGSLFYRFTPMTDALIDYNYSVVDYKTSDTNDNKNHSAYVGVSIEPTAMISGYLKIGYAKKDYDQTIAGRNGPFTTFSTLVDLTYKISPLYALMLKATRTIEEDTDTNAPVTITNAVLSFRYNIPWNEALSLNPFMGYGTKKFEVNTTDVDGVSKLRDDKNWSAGIGLGYAPRPWLSTNLSYTHNTNTSNFRRYDYKENIVFLNVMVSF